MKGPKDNLNKSAGKSNPKKKSPAKGKGFGQLGAAAAAMPPAPASPMMNSPYNMQGMP